MSGRPRPRRAAQCARGRSALPGSPSARSGSTTASIRRRRPTKTSAPSPSASASRFRLLEHRGACGKNPLERARKRIIRRPSAWAEHGPRGLTSPRRFPWKKTSTHRRRSAIHFPPDDQHRRHPANAGRPWRTCLGTALSPTPLPHFPHTPWPARRLQTPKTPPPTSASMLPPISHPLSESRLIP